MAAKSPAKGDCEKTLEDALLRVVSNFENLHDLSKQQSAAAITFFVSGTDTFVPLPTGHGKSLIYQPAIPLAKELRKYSGLFSLPISPILLVASPLNALIDDQIRSCEVFGLKCVKLEEFKEGDSVHLLFPSPETLEKH